MSELRHYQLPEALQKIQRTLDQHKPVDSTLAATLEQGLAWLLFLTTPPAEEGSAWECFFDECYYEMWCVRPKNCQRGFNDPQAFHFVSKVQADIFMALMKHASWAEYRKDDKT